MLEGRHIRVALQTLRLGTSVVREFGFWGRARVTRVTCTNNPTVTNYCCRIIVTKSPPNSGEAYYRLICVQYRDIRRLICVLI